MNSTNAHFDLQEAYFREMSLSPALDKQLKKVRAHLRFNKELDLNNNPAITEQMDDEQSSGGIPHDLVTLNLCKLWLDKPENQINKMIRSNYPDYILLSRPLLDRDRKSYADSNYERQQKSSFSIYLDWNNKSAGAEESLSSIKGEAREIIGALAEQSKIIEKEILDHGYHSLISIRGHATFVMRAKMLFPEHGIETILYHKNQDGIKILNVYGSNLYGSSAAIANRFVEKSALLGAEIISFELSGANINKCKKCMSCKTKTDRCAIRDDITALLDTIVKCDVLVLSTGIYGADVTQDLSIFTTRLFSFLKPDFETDPHPSRFLPGKKLLFIQAQGGSKDFHNEIYESYELLFKKLGFGDIFVIQADSVEGPSDLKERDDIMKQAEEIAEKVSLGGRIK